MTNLNSILKGFNKTVRQLDKFIGEQQTAVEVRDKDIVALRDRIAAKQAQNMAAKAEMRKAESVKAKILDLIEG
mgnify:CR=1 FL=1